MEDSWNEYTRVMKIAIQVHQNDEDSNWETSVALSSWNFKSCLFSQKTSIAPNYYNLFIYCLSQVKYSTSDWFHVNPILHPFGVFIICNGVQCDLKRSFLDISQKPCLDLKREYVFLPADCAMHGFKGRLTKSSLLLTKRSKNIWEVKLSYVTN